MALFDVVDLIIQEVDKADRAEEHLKDLHCWYQRNGHVFQIYKNVADIIEVKLLGRGIDCYLDPPGLPCVEDTTDEG
jgi:hypothetical protein